MSASARSELAPTGRLRVGINFGNALLAVKDANGMPGDIAVRLAQESSRRAGVPMDIVGYESAGAMADGAKVGAWDVAFLVADPNRAQRLPSLLPIWRLTPRISSQPGRRSERCRTSTVTVFASPCRRKALTTCFSHAPEARPTGARAKSNASVISSSRNGSMPSRRFGQCSSIPQNSIRDACPGRSVHRRHAGRGRAERPRGRLAVPP